MKMNKKVLTLMAAAALGLGALAATPAGNQARAEGFGFWIDLGDRGRHHAGPRYRDPHWRHAGPRHGHRFYRVHPRAVRYELRRRGYHHIRNIRFHDRAIHRHGHRVRGFYTARAVKRGHVYRVFLDRRGRPFFRRHLY